LQQENYATESLHRSDFPEKNSDKENVALAILDGLEDPHNLGAILRTGDATGINGVIIPKNRSVSLNSTVAKVSTGAIEHVDVVQVTNLVTAMKELKDNGYWIIGLELDGSVDYRKQDYTGKIAVVIGSEGKGISRLVKENCDFLVNIPMIGHVNSLNASVSASILFYEILRNRGN
jgi:23S rRNA (guanosine2251-2'-O)-methyltransferase